MTQQDLYQLIKQEVRIIDYASRLGFTVVRKGRYYSLKEHDSVIIDPDKNCFWRNSIPGKGSAIGQGGSVIDFVMAFTEMTLHETLKLLTEEVHSLDTLPKFEKKRPGEVKRNTDLSLPEADHNMHNVYAYLIKTRKIAAGAVQELVDRKQIYQDLNKNCVFVSYDLKDSSKPVFVCRRGTNTYKPFYGDSEGCDYSQCFYINNRADKIYITESVIDALSVMTLKTGNKYNYLAMGGVGKTDCIYTYLKMPEIKEIWIGTDRDDHGREAAGLLQEIIAQERPDVTVILDLPPAPYKDWNEYLQEKEKRR